MITDDWVSTFHKVPKALDSSLAANGAVRLADAGFGDVAAGDIFNDFDKWQDEVFWPVFGDIKSSAEDDAGFDIEIDTSSRRTTLRQDVKEAVIRSNELLTSEGEPEKRHIVLTLPTAMNYKVGDYLAVLPINSSVNIRRVLRRFGLPWDAMLTIKGGNTTLPTGHPLSAMDILGAYVELSQPATRRVSVQLPGLIIMLMNNRTSNKSHQPWQTKPSPTNSSASLAQISMLKLAKNVSHP